jgi:glutamate carboxypeptidase
MRKCKISLPLCLLGLALASPALAGPPNEKLRAAAEAAKPALIDTLRDMVMIESGSSDVEGLAKMADFTEARLKALGAKTERRKVTRGAGADIVIGTFEGSGHKKLMLMAHMDTVYERGILATQPWRVDGERIYGPGIADDKGGIAVVLHALKILKEVEWREYAKITVLFNPDEEVGSIGSGELISEIADQHDFVLSCEPTVRHPRRRMMRCCWGRAERPPAGWR